jgi:hypothetical protein
MGVTNLVVLTLLAAAFFVALAVPFLAVWVPVRAMRGRARLRRVVEAQGYRVRRMELRWLTRGPFATMRPAGLKYSDWLYRVVAEDRETTPRVAWIRWRPGRPWQPDDHWELQWDDNPDGKPGGIPTAIFGAMMLAGTAAAIFLIYSATRNLDGASSVNAHSDTVQRFV